MHLHIKNISKQDTAVVILSEIKDIFSHQYILVMPTASFYYIL